MQLRKSSDYSLRVLIFLARRQGVHTTIRDVAQAHAISESHLMKVVQKLAKRGYVRTLRGKGGGISLARSPGKISVGDIVRDVEPFTPAECFVPGYRGSCKLYPNCRLRRALCSAQSSFLATLDEYSLNDVMVPNPVCRPARKI
jgi:Rrf2 family nitric oxide-sensitive transcriptional repressor